MDTSINVFPQKNFPSIVNHPISASLLVVKGENVYRLLQERIMKWAFTRERGVKNIPEEAWKGETFEIDTDYSEFAGAIKIDEPKYWAFRLREQLKDSQNRVWITDIGIAEKQPKEVLFGFRLSATQKGDGGFIPRTVPSLVRSVCYKMDTFLDGGKTSPDPLKVCTKEDVIDLVDFLTDESRRCPVVVFSLPYGEDDISKAPIDIKKFIRRTVGCVHSVVITSTASYYLTDEVTKYFSTFNGAVRTYNPKFHPDYSSPFEHPITTLTSIQNWSAPTEGGDYMDFLINRVLKPTRSGEELERDIPSYQTVKQFSFAKLRSEKNNDDTDALLKYADNEIKTAEQRIAEYQELLVTAETQRDQLEQDCNRWKAQYFSLQDYVNKLIRQNTETKVNIPTDLKNFEDWVENNLQGQVVVHNRAIKAVKDTDFENKPLIYEALLLLRDYYVPMKHGEIPQKKYLDRCAELGLDDQQCFSQLNKAKQFGHEYFVQYDGRSCELNRHLKGSSSRKRQLSFRLYYFWDSPTNQVVVGYMPGHLKNDKS